MKSFRYLTFAVVLTLLLSVTALAGDISSPGITAPGDIGTPGITAFADVATPGKTGDQHNPGITEGVLGFLLDLIGY